MYCGAEGVMKSIEEANEIEVVSALASGRWKGYSKKVIENNI